MMLWINNVDDNSVVRHDSEVTGSQEQFLFHENYKVYFA